jgi:hypothetical protein
MGCGHCGEEGHNRRTCHSHNPDCFHEGCFIGEEYFKWRRTSVYDRLSPRGFGGFKNQRQQSEYWRLLRKSYSLSVTGVGQFWSVATAEQSRCSREEAQKILDTLDEEFTQVLEPIPDHVRESDGQLAGRLSRPFAHSLPETTSNPTHVELTFNNQSKEHLSVFWFNKKTKTLRFCCNITSSTKGSEMRSQRVKNYSIGTKLYIALETSQTSCTYSTTRCLDPDRWRQRNYPDNINISCLPCTPEILPRANIYMKCSVSCVDQVITIPKTSPYQNKFKDCESWKKSALRMDFLLKEMIKLGADNGESYPNLAPIADLHQDVILPQHSEADKEQSGIPSLLTNVS